jgi:Flp pilus assembly protein TadD
MSQVLEKKQTNVKALFRRSTARAELGDFFDAKADLQRALELDPGSSDLQARHHCR